MPDNCRYCGLPMHAEGSCLENVNKMPDKDLKDLCEASQDGRLKKQMPDRVGEILKSLKEYGWEHGSSGITIAQAKSELLKVVCEEVEKMKKECKICRGEDITCQFCEAIAAYNKGISDVIEAMERLFVKEIA